MLSSHGREKLWFPSARNSALQNSKLLNKHNDGYSSLLECPSSPLAPVLAPAYVCLLGFLGNLAMTGHVARARSVFVDCETRTGQN